MLIRTSTERPEVLDKGTVIVGGISYDNLVQSVELAKSMQENNEPMLDAIDYKDTNVSTKVRKLSKAIKILSIAILGGSKYENCYPRSN